MSAMEEVLIELVRQHRCLWQPSDANYFNKPLKNLKWVEIARQLPGPSGALIHPEVAKRKWKALKDARAANRRKMKGKSGQANSYIKIYRYASMMSFLDGIDEETENAPTTSNLSFINTEQVVDDTVQDRTQQQNTEHQQSTEQQQSTDETVLDSEVVLRDTQLEHLYFDSAVAQTPQFQDTQAGTGDPPPRSISPPSPHRHPTPVPPLEGRPLASRLTQRNLAQQNRAEYRRRIIQQRRLNSQNRPPASDPNADEPARQPEPSRPPPRRRGDVDAVTETILQELRRNPEDEHTHFCLSLAPILRSLPASVGSELRIKILRLVHETQYGEF